MKFGKIKFVIIRITYNPITPLLSKSDTRTARFNLTLSEKKLKNKIVWNNKIESKFIIDVMVFKTLCIIFLITVQIYSAVSDLNKTVVSSFSYQFTGATNSTPPSLTEFNRGVFLPSLLE